MAEYCFLRRFFSAQTTLGYAPFRFVRFFARARFHRASSFRTAAFGTVSALRKARSKFSNWFGPAQRALRSAIVSACVFIYSSIGNNRSVTALGILKVQISNLELLFAGEHSFVKRIEHPTLQAHRRSDVKTVPFSALIVFFFVRLSQTLQAVYNLSL